MRNNGNSTPEQIESVGSVAARLGTTSEQVISSRERRT